MNALKRATLFIPAFRKGARFQDDLVKKLAGVSLVQRAVDKARLLGCSEKSIHLLTDSEDIALVGKRNKVGVICRPTPSLENTKIDGEFRKYVTAAEQDTSVSILLSPYAPLLEVKSLQQAVTTFLRSKVQVLKPVRTVKRHLFDDSGGMLSRSKLGNGDKLHQDQVESRAFMLLLPGQLLRVDDVAVSVHPWDAGDDAFEIETLQDWWVSEKLLQRKRIVFRIIGNNRVGMGHVYRALALAHELHDHEIIFVTDTQNHVAVEAIVKRDYWLGVYPPGRIIDEIISLRPDIVINDVLNTKRKDIEKFRNAGSVTVSFEDLGAGARFTDLTVNEIYDTPRFEASNVLWGKKYFFLRDEFQLARPHRFKKKVDGVMLVFGGTDQHDLARKIFLTIKSLCNDEGVFIHIVTGPGYRGYKRLMREVKDNEGVSLTHDSEVISNIMERVQVAVTSNGRTVYEFAHMNIPAIVIGQHKREVTHAFASRKNGFVQMGLYKPGVTEERVRSSLKKLIQDTKHRRDLHRRLVPYRFHRNKTYVLKALNNLL
jgi:spore coat polysaccharide biosynthesis predicted glycosyltransferase SpsG/CMP-N-acetylneuraminic acid synthetase